MSRILCEKTNEKYISYLEDKIRAWEMTMWQTTTEDGFRLNKQGSEALQRLLSEIIDLFCDPHTSDIQELIEIFEDNEIIKAKWEARRNSKK